MSSGGEQFDYAPSWYTSRSGLDLEEHKDLEFLVESHVQSKIVSNIRYLGQIKSKAAFTYSNSSEANLTTKSSMMIRYIVQDYII